jgi:histidinol-phosphate/aromatic aminotransferase/cobyric acid decarboxylase-like protein
MSHPAAVWDVETQEVHGGQTWRALGASLVADFSVTTNALGTPRPALEAAADALRDVHHYPAADCADAAASLAAFCAWPQSQLLLGNGASEFIDLVMRAAPPGPFRPGPYPAAYMEYNRAAKAAGREVLAAAHKDAPALEQQQEQEQGQEQKQRHVVVPAAVTVIIHPNSPTGHCMSLTEMEEMIVKASDEEGIFVIDESFIVFYGEDWRSQSALSLIDKYPEKVLVLSSWTKLWSCPGLRLGSIAASASWTRRLKRLQTPWSCSSIAQAFFVAACADTAYLRATWATLPGWKDMTNARVRALGWRVNESSPLWVPWTYVDCGGSAEVAAKAAEVAHKSGCPVRLCATFGTPSCIRLGIRGPAAQDVLFAAWSAAGFGGSLPVDARPQQPQTTQMGSQHEAAASVTSTPSCSAALPSVPLSR